MCDSREFIYYVSWESVRDFSVDLQTVTASLCLTSLHQILVIVWLIAPNVSILCRARLYVWDRKLTWFIFRVSTRGWRRSMLDFMSEIESWLDWFLSVHSGLKAFYTSSTRATHVTIYLPGVLQYISESRSSIIGAFRIAENHLRRLR